MNDQPAGGSAGFFDEKFETTNIWPTLKVFGHFDDAEKVGLRESCFGGDNGTDRNKFYVNGREVKLLGTCRYDISLRCGRTTTSEEDRQEIRAYRDVNIMESIALPEE
ncbi:MAG: hypothetical protein IJ240_05200 [Clostridia bacterium]|nr:hypothetical protein [Clostridia bacterium]